MTVFENPGRTNTEAACRIAVERAALLGAPIIAASTEGAAGVKLCEIAGEMGFTGKIVIVTHAFGAKEPGKNALKDEHRAALINYGATLVTAAHALSGAERALSTKFQGIYPLEIVAHTLRMVSQGFKVTVEISCMALDAGAVDYGSVAVCLGGSGHGLDTAVVLTPSHANRLLETKIHEILCMPY